MSRRAHGELCRCGAATLAGADADACALQAVVDPRPLTRSGELLAVAAGRVTYEIDAGNRLHRRDRWSIRSAPSRPVLAEHRCYHPIPGDWIAPPSPRPAPATEGTF